MTDREYAALRCRYKNALEDSLRLTGCAPDKGLEEFFSKLGLSGATMSEVRAAVRDEQNRASNR
jgi:hypothetical protein